MSLGSLLVLVVLRLLLKKPALAALGFALIQIGPRVLADDPPGLYSAVVFSVIAGWITLLFLRFGLLASIVGIYFADFLLACPVVGEFSGWLAAGTIFPLLLIVAVGVYAVRPALAGRSLLGERLDASVP